ncbi:hypothetical protein WA158_003673 [Blastocystis sp. Blastoise]
MAGFLYSAFLISSSIASYSLYGIYTKLSKENENGYEHSTFMSSFVTELIKCIISFISFKWECFQDKNVRKQFEVKEIFLWVVPSLLYCVANNLYSLIITISDPITAQVYGSLEIVTVGLFSVLILKKKINGTQWAALVLVCTSVAEIELGKSSESIDDFNILALFYSIISSSFAACAGVVIEKLMKNHKDMSFFQQSIWLYFWGCITNMTLLVINNGKNSVYWITLQNFNKYTYLAIMVSVYRGLITGLILKHLNSIIKSFASSFSLVFTAVGIAAHPERKNTKTKGKKTYVSFRTANISTDVPEEEQLNSVTVQGNTISSKPTTLQLTENPVSNPSENSRGNTSDHEEDEEEEEEIEYTLRPTIRLQQQQ